MKLEKNGEREREREKEMLLSETHDVNKLTNGFQSLHFTSEPMNPFLLQTLPTNPFDDMGLSPSSKIINGFDPYWDSNALNLSPEAANKNGVWHSSIYDEFRGDRNVVSLLARDLQGCRFLEGKFDERKQRVDLIFDGLLNVMDAFGNYLMQKLFDVCSDE